jgi:hypothetical protein
MKLSLPPKLVEKIVWVPAGYLFLAFLWPSLFVSPMMVPAIEVLFYFLFFFEETIMVQV